MCQRGQLTYFRGFVAMSLVSVTGKDALVALIAVCRELAARAPPLRIVLRCSFGALAVLLPTGGFLLRRLLEKIYASIPALPPTTRQLREEDAKANPMFRAFPFLRGKLAWRELGKYPTPVHLFSCAVPSEDDKAIQFWVKREDLSSERYGPNAAVPARFLRSEHGEKC